MLLRCCPPMLFAPPKVPPAKILPSACTAMAETYPFALAFQELSSVPSELSRAMWLRVTVAPPFGASAVKSPPIRILPSGCTTTTFTVSFAFGLKPSRADCARICVVANRNNKSVAAMLTNFRQHVVLWRCLGFAATLGLYLFALIMIHSGDDRYRLAQRAIGAWGRNVFLRLIY